MAASALRAFRGGTATLAFPEPRLPRRLSLSYGSFGQKREEFRVSITTPPTLTAGHRFSTSSVRGRALSKPPRETTDTWRESKEAGRRISQHKKKRRAPVTAKDERSAKAAACECK